MRNSSLKLLGVVSGSITLRYSVLRASSWLLPCFRAYSIFTSTPVSGHGTAASLIQWMRSMDAVFRDLELGLQMEVPPSMAKSKEAQHDRLYVEGHDLCICGGSTVSDRMGQVGRYRLSEPSPVKLFLWFAMIASANTTRVHVLCNICILYLARDASATDWQQSRYGRTTHHVRCTFVRCTMLTWLAWGALLSHTLRNATIGVDRK